MGLPQKDVESEGKKWVVAGISLRTPLKSINTNKLRKGSKSKEEEEIEEESTITTPTARIPEKFPCPPPPRKRRPALKCHLDNSRVFFSPPDLESVFKVSV
ncbi:hypothetical protein ACHQM5_011115 [Ranunculus cassubicifolius]